MELNTVIKYDLIDGSRIEMTMTYGKLLKARTKYPEAYEDYNKVEMGGAKDIFSFIDVIYMAYLCANMENDKVMKKDEFIEKLNPNRKELLGAYNALMYPKKKTVSDAPSNAGHEAAKAG